MKTRYLVAALTGLMGMLFAKRRSYPGSAMAGGLNSAAFGQSSQTFRPWGFGSHIRKAKVRQVRPRRRGPLSGLFGFLWGMFWLWFGLSFVFGWHEPRHTVLGFITGFAADAVRWATSLFTSVGGMVQ